MRRRTMRGGRSLPSKGVVVIRLPAIRRPTRRLSMQPLRRTWPLPTLRRICVRPARSGLAATAREDPLDSESIHSPNPPHTQLKSSSRPYRSVLRPSIKRTYRTNRPESSVTEASGMKDGRPWIWAIYVPAAGRPSITTELRRRLNFSTPFWT